MKTDRALTVQECLDEWFAVPTHVNAPGTNAHQIPVTAQEDVEVTIEVHGCRCDRWGHPCAGCFNKRKEPDTARSDFRSENN